MAERIDEAVQRLHQEGKLNRIGREGSRLSVNFDDSGPLSAESTFDPVFRVDVSPYQTHRMSDPE